MVLDIATLRESPDGRAPGVPYSQLYDDIYHSEFGAAEQAQSVFLQGNGLPERWRSRSRFVILETGFGLGNNFLQTWSAWRDDPQRCGHLFFVSIEKHPFTRTDMARIHTHGGDLSRRLIEAWPPLTAGMHTLNFDDEHGQVTLLLGLGDVADLLPALVMQVDAIYLDGFAPASNPQMWDEGMLSRIGRLASPGCTAATWTLARSVRDGLTRSGFKVERAPGSGSKCDRIEARFQPYHQAQAPAGGMRAEPAPPHRQALVIGAGLAGCAAAWGLTREGWSVTLIDQHQGAAEGASGNLGGLFHSIVHGEDGIHARAHRAAALALHRQVTAWISSGLIKGQVTGLLRLDDKTKDEAACELIAKLGLPADYVRWLDKDAAQAASGISVPCGGWLFEQAGWLHPAGLAQAMLADACTHAREHGQVLDCIWGQGIERLSHDERGWHAWGADLQTPIAGAPTVVLATASGVNDLLAGMPQDMAVEPLPLASTRGQVSILASDAAQRHAFLPRIPVAGNGYALTLPDGRLLCGATSQPDDDCAEVRAQDHAHNLHLARQLGALHDQVDVDALARSSSVNGRTGWRASTPDRLPLIGAWPLATHRLLAGGFKRLDQTRMIPRARDNSGGLFVMSGLGSRGITWSILAGQLLTHWVAGTPCPVEADLRDALDPARFSARNRSKNTA